MAGKVYLVGAGPGDPRLITVRGKELLERADVILFDALISTQLLHWAREDCVRIYVGKQAGRSSITQDEINAKLVELAREGKAVVRLKGGDPFIFGRGGEEAMACRKAGVDFEIVPGVSSAIAAPATAGIPVLHRHLAGSVLVLHGRLKRKDDSTSPVDEDDPGGGAAQGGIVIRKHRRRSPEDPGLMILDSGMDIPVELSDGGEGNGGPEEDTPLTIDWDAACRAADTLVILMGLGKMDEIREGLLAGGRPAQEPVAVVQWGTMPMQRTVVSTLDEFPKMVRAAGLTGPAVIVVGEVVSLRPHLNVFESRPLFGWRVGFAEGEVPHADFADALAEAGAQPLLVRCSLPASFANTPEEKQALLAQFREATHVFLPEAELAAPFFKGLEASSTPATSLLKDVRLLCTSREGADALAVHGFAAEVIEPHLSGREIETALGMTADRLNVVVLEREGDWVEFADELEDLGAMVSYLSIEDAVGHEPGIARLTELLAEHGLEALFLPDAGVVAALRRSWGEERMLGLLKSVVLLAGDDGALKALEAVGLTPNLRNAAASPDKLVRKLTNFRSSLGAQRTVVTDGTPPIPAAPANGD